jgi:aryl-alcohol dehydrogenase-like predicted oxidoreductase
MSLDHYYHLGKSGLRVSRLALGTMTFGDAGIRGISGNWGSDRAEARQIFQRYVEKGGNFIDTADSYGAGASETLLGEFVAEFGLREQLVITTKFSNSQHPGNPNAGGNGRKNIMRAVEASLRRLKTDYIDLYLLHTWDRITPVEEVVRSLDDLIRQGKIRYMGLSDVPGWYAARAQTWAETHGLAAPINLQLPYSLVERSIEPEFISLAEALGPGITAWSPLAMGLLSGKYRAASINTNDLGSGRLTQDISGGGLGLFTERNRAIVLALEKVADQIGRGMAQVALNWCVNRPGIAAAIIGARQLSQLDENLGALEFNLPPELSAQLDAASAPQIAYPYSLFADDYQAAILNTGAAVGDKPESYHRRQFLPKVTDYAFTAPKAPDRT